MFIMYYVTILICCYWLCSLNIFKMYIGLRITGFLPVLSLSTGCQRNSLAEKWQSLAECLAGDRLVKHNRQFRRQHKGWCFTPSLSRLNLIFRGQPNFSATKLPVVTYKFIAQLVKYYLLDNIHTIIERPYVKFLAVFLFLFRFA